MSIDEAELMAEMAGRTLFRDLHRTRAAAKILHKCFGDPKIGIFGHTSMPEGEIPRSVAKGSYEHLMFITMTVSIDYQRDAPALWESGRRTIDDALTRWLYIPGKVMENSQDALMEAMRKHGLSKKHRKDAQIWRTVSRSLSRFFGGDPRNLLEECNYDAVRVLDALRWRYKKDFPYLSGPKILPLWIRMMHDVVEIDLRNLEQIPIPVDVHVARATLSLGCLRGAYSGTISGIFADIDGVWREACDGLPYYRLQMDEPLWHLSKYGCTSRIDNLCSKKLTCPVGDLCAPGTVYVSSERVEVNTSIEDRSA